MGTLVSPIHSATLAMPLARFWMERHAWEEREARLSIVDDAEVDGGGLRRGRWARICPFLFDPPCRVAPARPRHPIAASQFFPQNQVAVAIAAKRPVPEVYAKVMRLRHDVCATCFPTTIDKSSQKNRRLNQSMGGGQRVDNDADCTVHR
jgi:hypothetical protein